MTNAVPFKIGNIARRTPTQLAEATIARIGELCKTRLTTFGVSLDLRGDIWIDRLTNAPSRELLMACNRASDPDVLAENIRSEVEARA